MDVNNRRLLIKIAHYYYKLGMTQDDIAKKLSMSRQRINRLSKRLIDEGIVKITINTYDNDYIEMESLLEKKFNLKEAFIIPRLEYEKVQKSLGCAGASYLSNILKDNTVIGVSWGTTLSEVAANMEIQFSNNISIVQIVGGMNLGDSSLKSDEIARSIAYSLNATPYLMYAPAIVKDINAHDAIMSEQSIQNIFSKISTCDIAIVGIGTLDKGSTLFNQKYLDPSDLEALKNAKAVGDICSRYYDIDGKEIKDNPNFSVIGISLDDLKNIDTVIGVAGGDDKAEAIYGALKGKYLNVLITDNVTAKEILGIDDRR
jgi:deoxyribonucleoside regulator